MKKNVFKHFFLLAAMFTIAACSSDDEITYLTPTVAETEINVESDVTFYATTVASRQVWSATVESGGEWLKLISAKGVGGTAEKLSFEMTRNTTKSPRQALINVACGTASTQLKVTQGPSAIEIMDESDVPNFNRYYKPQEFGSMDMLRNDSKWSFYRYKQSNHFFVFWEAGFGDDPNAESVPANLRVDIDDLLEKAEQFYKTNIDRLVRNFN